MTGSSFVISRIVDAPRELVWRLHTQADHLKNWMGPKGFPMTHCTMDLRVGGVFHYCLQIPGGGGDMWGKWTFRRIEAPHLLECIVSFSDADQGVTRHPMGPDWPLQTLGITTFEETPDGKTRITVNWSAYEPTPAEQACFDGGHDSMEQGWGGTFEQFLDYLARVK